MEGDQRGNPRRAVPAKPEKAKKEGIGNLFKELRAMLQNHGYPAKGDKSRALQSTSAIAQRKEVKLNPGGSQDKQSWVPFFRNYEDCNQMILQSLDGFMIILSVDGVIMFVGENIMSLLGHLPRDIVGKKLLTLLHDEEKNEVYRKIALKLPLSCSVGNHVEFCCYLKRGNVELEERPTYEYVKFILILKHMCNESLAFFGGFNPKCTCPTTSVASNLLWEDQFYFVGTVCVLRSEVLQELHTAKQSSETIVVQDSDEEHLSGHRRSARRQRRNSRMEAQHGSESAVISLDDDVDIVEVEQYGEQESVHVIQIDSSSSSSETSISSSGMMPESPTSSSFQSFEFESEVDLRNQQEPIDLEYSVDTEYIDDSMDQNDVIDLVSQEASLEPDFSENSLDSVDQEEDEVEFVEEEVYPDSSMAAIGDAQMQRVTSRHLFSPEPHSSGMMSRSQYAGKTKRSVEDFKKAKRFRDSFSSFEYAEDLEETCVSYTQDNFYEQDQYLYKEELQEEDQPIDSPVEIKDDEQETIDYYHDEDFEHKDERHSLLPEEQEESFMDPLPSVHSSSSDTISLSCFPQSPGSTVSSIDALVTPEDFMQLWQEPPSPHDLDEEDTWLSNDQNSMQDIPTWKQQVQAPDTNTQGSLEAEAIEATATSQLEMRSNIQSAENSNSGDPEDLGDLGDPGEPGDLQ